jgi:N utilization substance protein B
MGRRRKARESALQILFQLEFNKPRVEEVIDRFWKEREASDEIRDYSDWIVKGIVSHQEEIDNLIQSLSDHWRLSRMAHVDRNILRIAVFEFLYEKNLAAAVIINEAIEIAKKYSSDEAAAFVNGILDSVRKKLEAGKDCSKEGKDD